MLKMPVAPGWDAIHYTSRIPFAGVSSMTSWVASILQNTRNGSLTMRGHLQGSLYSRAACLSITSGVAAARDSVTMQRSPATYAPCSSDKLRGKNRIRAENPLNSGPCGNLWSGSCGWSRALIVITLGTGIAIPLTVVTNADYVRTPAPAQLCFVLAVPSMVI